MKYVILITLAVIFSVWLFDASPMTTNVTAYRAKCHGDLITYDNCWGDMSTGKVQIFNISSHLGEVYLVVENDIPKPLGECKIQDRKNWQCAKEIIGGGVDYYWMTNGLYVHNQSGKETETPLNKTLPVLRHQWVWLYIKEIPSNLQKWLQQSKEQHFKKRVYEDTSSSATVY